MADPLDHLMDIVAVGERVSRNVVSRMARDDLPGPLQRVLVYLQKHPGSTDRTIVNQLAIGSPHLSGLMKAMSDRGCVQAIRSTSHQSQWLRSLTPEGELEATRINTLRRDAFSAAYRSLSAIEQSALDTASRELFPRPPSRLGQIKVVNWSQLTQMLSIAQGVLGELGWRPESRIYVARRHCQSNVAVVRRRC